MARAAVATQKLITQKTPQLYNRWPFRRVGAHFKALDKNSFDATAGIHVNVSLQARSTQDNIFVNQPDVMEKLAAASVAAQRSLLATVIESEDSLLRFQNKKGTAKFLAYSHNKKDVFSVQIREDNKVFLTPAQNNTLEKKTVYYPETRRIENRLPGADADPALAVLMSIAGLYHGLKNQQKLQQSDALLPYIVPEGAHPIKEILTHFEHDNLAREMLGPELHNAVLSCRKQQYAAISSTISK